MSLRSRSSLKVTVIGESHHEKHEKEICCHGHKCKVQKVKVTKNKVNLFRWSYLPHHCLHIGNQNRAIRPHGHAQFSNQGVERERNKMYGSGTKNMSSGISKICLGVSNENMGRGGNGKFSILPLRISNGIALNYTVKHHVVPSRYIHLNLCCIAAIQDIYSLSQKKQTFFTQDVNKSGKIFQMRKIIFFPLPAHEHQHQHFGEIQGKICKLQTHFNQFTAGR